MQAEFIEVYLDDCDYSANWEQKRKHDSVESIGNRQLLNYFRRRNAIIDQKQILRNSMLRYASLLVLFGCTGDTSIKQYNDNPEIEIVSHEVDTVFAAGDEIFFRALVSDLNHKIDDLTIQWLVGTEVICEGQKPDTLGESICSTTLATDDTQIQAEVRDPEGGFAFDILIFTVESNSPPTTPNIQIVPNPAGSGDPLTVTISGATDPDGDEITYRTVWFKDGTEYSNTEGISATETQKGEEWRVMVYASDGELESEPAEDSLIIVNGVPQIDSISITSTDGFYNTSTLSCNANPSDPDSDPLDITYSWTIDGQNAGQDTTLMLTPQIAQPTANVTCTVTATDTDGETQTAQTTETLQNRLPLLSDVSLTPTTPTTVQDLNLTYSLADEDGDTSMLSIAWYVDGSLVQQGQENLASSFYGRDQVVSVELEPSDVYGVGPTQSVSLTIVNSPPQGAALRIDPENPRAGVDDLHCALETEPIDPDGDTISHLFSWMRNGSPYTGSTLDLDHIGDGIPSSETADGDTWECTYTAEDDTLSSPSISIETEVGPNVCYGYVSNTHEVSSCTIYETQTQQSCVPTSSGVTTCYPQYCDTGETNQPQHNSDGSSTGAYCSDWGQCEGNPSYDVSGQAGWDWVSGWWTCTYTDVTVPVTVYGGSNCGYYYTCDLQQVSCGTPDECTP